MKNGNTAFGMYFFGISMGIIFAGFLSGTPAIAQTGPMLEGCPVLPADHIWNTPIENLPVHSNSSAFISTIGSAGTLHPDFGSGLWDGGPIGIPYTVVSGSQPRVNITFDYADESDPGPYPIPPNAAIEGGSQSSGDRHVLVLDRDNCILYETFSSYPQPDGSWRAGSGAVFNLRSNALRPSGWTSADAAGLPILPGLIRYGEVAGGEIPHAVRFTAPQTRREFLWPARHYASNLTASNYPPMGQRFRLKADFDISHFSAGVQVILRALKKYGMILADNGSAWYLSGVPDPRWDNDTLVSELRQISGSNFEAIDESSLMVNPNSGQAAQAINPQIAVLPGSHNFGGILLGASSSPAAIRISNSGNADLLLGAIIVSGTDSALFAKQNDGCSAQTIFPSGHCILEVVFSPTSEGPKSSQLSIPSNDPNIPTLVFPLNGTGVTKIIHTLGIYRAGAWYLDMSGNDSWDGCGADGCQGPFGGLGEDIPVTGDWTGDGKSKIGITRRTGNLFYWYLDKNGNGAWDGCQTDGCLGPFGGLGEDIPVTGDWTGDGKSKIGITRRTGNLFYWYLDKNGNGAWDGCQTDGCLGPFGGLAEDIPMTGDWTGDGKSKIGITRRTGNLFYWYLDKNGNGAWDGCQTDGCLGPFGGLAEDIPMTGDWTGDGKSKIGITRRTGNLFYWYLDKNGNGAWDGCQTDGCLGPFGGLPVDVPIVGIW